MLERLSDSPPSADSSVPPDGERPAGPSPERVLGFVLAILVAYRLAYHASYLGDVPFAHATFSDGAVYEQAARDLLASWPLGSRAFYLQGAYAYLLALGMRVQAWPSIGLLLQLVVAAASLGLFHRSAKRLWGRRAGMLASIVLLGHAGLTFYENKYLSAELGVATNILALAAFIALLRRDSDESRARLGLRLLGLGAALGLSVLARPNMILALPFALLGVVVLVRARDHARPARALAGALVLTLLGAGLSAAPMAARNQIVTGHPDIAPVHGGGTSFFIGNNPKSKGVWNDGGLLSARLGTESQELAATLGVDPSLPERARARAIGNALYARSLDWIRANPGTWLRLELHKLWLTVGDEQLTQDYDWLGEQELLPWAHRVSVPFSWLMALALLGVVGLVRRPHAAPKDGSHMPQLTRAQGLALGCFLLGQLLAPLAANLLYFTSAQHRLPLVLPLALLAGPGLLALGRGLARARSSKRARELLELTPAWVLLLALALVAQGYWKRTKRSAPHPVHYYNLAMVQDSIGEPVDALHSLDRAIELREGQPIFHLRRAHLRLRLGELDAADADLDMVEAIAADHPVPAWVLDQAELDRHSIFVERTTSGQRSRPAGRFR